MDKSGEKAPSDGRDHADLIDAITALREHPRPRRGITTGAA